MALAKAKKMKLSDYDIL